MNNSLHVGLDVGSTTVKVVVMNENKETIYSNYERHFSDTKNTVCNTILKLLEKFPSNNFTLALTGSGAMSAAKFLRVNFIQEVVSCKRAVEKYIPETDVVIELGGEDAKIIYFDKSIEQRMNGTCAGGTGAFLDQMASLLHTDTAGLNELAKDYNTIYPIEIKKAATIQKDWGKSFSVLSKINNKSIGKGYVVCMVDKPVNISNSVTAIPVEYI